MGHEDNHGNTLAAWVGVGVLLVAFGLACAGFAFEIWWMVWVGIGVAVVGLVAAKGLQMAGHGKQQDAA